MRDGLTEKRRAHPGEGGGLAGFLERYEATLVVVRGSLAGEEYPLDRDKLAIGRGPGVDITFDDVELSAQHAAIEFSGECFRVSDLGSTNGTFVNGKPIHAKDLKSSDRIELGRHLLQFRLEVRPREPRVYLVPDD